MTVQSETAEYFRSLHHGKHILVLPNAWDVPSARVFEEAGFPAVATSSAGMMVSLGYPDGEEIGRSEFTAAVKRIARALSVPLSVDVVGGFGATPKEIEVTVKSVLRAGAVGINIEDFEHATRRLHDVERQVRKLKAIRKLGRSIGIPLVINARTDALRLAPGEEEAKFNEAVRRALAYKDAEVDCVYPMGLADASGIARFLEEVSFPVNVMVRRGLPPVGELERLGVARVSFGPAASYATFGLLKRAAREVLEEGTYRNLIEGAITFDELNRLALPKK